MRPYQILILAFALNIGTMVEASARDYSVTPDTAAIKFQLIKRNNALIPSGYNIAPPDADPYAGQMEQSHSSNYYDALFYYPVHQRSGLNIDLGINLRFQEQNTDPYRALGSDRHWLHNLSNETSEYHSSDFQLPSKTLVHAAALFELPFEGLSAGVSGSHDGRLENAEFNYSARLNYQWKNGLGLQGGWQHQQYPLDQTNLDETIEDQRLFLDLKYKF